MANSKWLMTALLGIFFLSRPAAVFAQHKQLPKGHEREYYIAAEQVEWDYAPSGLELMHGAELPVSVGTPSALAQNPLRRIYRRYFFPAQTATRMAGNPGANHSRGSGRYRGRAFSQSH